MTCHFQDVAGDEPPSLCAPSTHTHLLGSAGEVRQVLADRLEPTFFFGIEQHNAFLHRPQAEGAHVCARSASEEAMETSTFLPLPDCGLSHENRSQAHAES